MEKNVLLAIVLAFLVLIIYQTLIPVPPQEPQRGSAQPPVATAPSTAPGQPSAKPEAKGPEAAFAQPLLSDQAAREITVETPEVAAVFTNRGAVLKSWRLKRFTDGGQPLELVPQGVPMTPEPFALALPDPQDTATLLQALFRPSATTVAAQSSPQTLDFEYRDAGGLAVLKSFTFDPAHPYLVTFRVRVERSGSAVNPLVELGPALGPGTNPSGSSYYSLPRAIFMKDGDVERIPSDKLADPARAVHEGSFTFGGVDEHYFLSSIVRPAAAMQVRYAPRTVPAAEGLPERHYIVYSARSATPAADTRVFIGPKDFDVLAAVDRDLVRAIDFGMFAFLVVPLLRALKWINSGVGNYGWSIVILTVLINAAMFPLRHKSVVSMRKMQEIQPEVKAIQDRYAKLKMSDPARQKMNVELMNLYRERGANPASGCVPMLLTFPVLIAFYSLLSVAIELRGAPFIGWIRDLSLPDPLYITPILMGATMVWQQKLTPMTTADPVQQKMMMFMPVMFTVFFLWAPSGLVLYWFVSNVWAIGQQIVTNRIIGPPRVHAMRPAAERRLKRAGGGRTDQAQSNQ